MSARDIVMAAAGVGGGDKIYVEDVFSTYLYTGNGSTQTITNGIDLAGEGGLVWIKTRTLSSNHVLFDSENANFGSYLHSNLADASFANSTVIAPISDGFEINNSGSSWNGSGRFYASWTFRKAPKFFDVVTYTGNGVYGRQIPHNLGSAPGAIIIKRTSSTEDWKVWHRSLSGTNYTLTLNSTAAQDSGTPILIGSPTSTYFSVTNSGFDNINGATYVAYIFAHDAGGFGDTGSNSCVACGSYTGNGSATGTVVNLGWEPQWLLIKRTDSTGDWNLIDNMRGLRVGMADVVLNPNLSSAEYSLTLVTPTATGFQLNTTNAFYNASGGTYIYVAIRRPMKKPESGTEVFSPNFLSASQGTAVTTNFPVDLQISTTTAVGFPRYVIDRMRGVATNDTALSTPLVYANLSNAEASSTSYTRDWNNTGFDVPGVWDAYQTVYWNFKRAPGFMDVVCWTGGTSRQTVSHNLGAPAELALIKGRSAASNWVVVGSALGSSSLRFNGNNSASVAFDFATDASTFTINQLASSSTTWVTYLFASVPGVSKVGTYTGTGTTQDINCGFSSGARFVMIKRTDSTGDWYVWDSARGITASSDPYSLMNTGTAQTTGTDYIDPLASGFQISSTAPAAINASGGTFLYLAIA